MTEEEYGAAYQRCFNSTVRFLVFRGVRFDYAEETAQAAWAKGWERISQLRDKATLLTWMNSIALNIHRTIVRRERSVTRALPELSVPPKVNVAEIDLRRILTRCKRNDRLVLQKFYVDGYKLHEIAGEQGWSDTATRIRLLRARRSIGERINHKVAPGKSAIAKRRGTGSVLESEAKAS